jgi:hypothetical protein
MEKFGKGTATLNSNSDPSLRQARVLKLIGYWTSSQEGFEDGPGWPHPRDLIGNWGSADRNSMIEYLGSGIVFRKYMGYSSCRICNKSLGTDELTDGTWAWPQRLEHYLEDHQVQLPTEFINSARAAAWRIPKYVRKEFSSPEIWLDAGATQTPADSTRSRNIVLSYNDWLDWAAAAISARPASDAIAFDEAKDICARLSHCHWKAHIEEKYGRWRILCQSQKTESLIYVEQCSATTLKRRLIAWRYPDPNALLDPEKAQSIATEFDGSWGVARVIAGTSDLWLIWVSPPGRKWPSKSEIEKATEGAEIGWTTFNPDGSKTFILPHLDELQWRTALNGIRDESCHPKTPLPSEQSHTSQTQKLPMAHAQEKSRLGMLWERLRSLLASGKGD